MPYLGSQTPDLPGSSLVPPHCTDLPMNALHVHKGEPVRKMGTPRLLATPPHPRPITMAGEGLQKQGHVGIHFHLLSHKAGFGWLVLNAWDLGFLFKQHCVALLLFGGQPHDSKRWNLTKIRLFETFGRIWQSFLNLVGAVHAGKCLLVSFMHGTTLDFKQLHHILDFHSSLFWTRFATKGQNLPN